MLPSRTFFVKIVKFSVPCFHDFPLVFTVAWNGHRIFFFFSATYFFIRDFVFSSVTFFYPPLLFSPRVLRLRGLTYTVTEQAAYHPAIRGVKTILMNNWFGIAKPAVTENHQHTKPPIISYKRGKSLKDTLVGAKI